jgi:hypothetical protein
MQIYVDILGKFLLGLLKYPNMALIFYCVNRVICRNLLCIVVHYQ